MGMSLLVPVLVSVGFVGDKMLCYIRLKNFFF